MSGICGIVALDGTTPSRSELAAMTALLERRGPEGTRHWLGGPAALGHTLLATTPEALVEQLPLTDPASGCTITADVRLDNREELIPALGLAGETRIIGDGELVLRAYLLWGEDCPRHLLGDFAFAIWDPRTQTLFCARDHMGMRQFNYCHVPGQIFVFSTEDTGVLAHPAVPRDLNEGRIADFIGDFEDFDFTSTFFEHVHRLPPAHSLRIGGQDCELRRYWRLEPGLRLQLESDEAYAEAFLAVFTEAVQSRLRSSGGVAAMLSGGLDSTAVSAVASGILSSSGQGPLVTISAVGPDPAKCPETQAIQSALSMGAFSPIFVNHVDFDGMTDELIAALQETRNPFEVHGTMLRCIYAAARRSKIKVVLDGGSGDVILTSDNRVASLLADGRFSSAYHELIGQKRFEKPTKPVRFMLGRFLSAAWVAFAPLALRSRLRQLRVSSQIPGVAPDLAKRVGTANRRRIGAEHLRIVAPSDPTWRKQVILHPHLVAGRERFDQLAASSGVECRDPFMDVRVVEYCLSLPSEQLEQGGWPKIILRRALEKRIPKVVVWRRGKEHLGGEFTASLLNKWRGWEDSMSDPLSPVRRYLLHDAIRDRLRGGNEPTLSRLSLFALDRFLRRFGDWPLGR